MIVNIVDSRKLRYRWKDINAVIESAWHDNSVDNSDQYNETENSVYEDRIGISIHEAIIWAENHSESVTLFLYNRGDGIE